ncbi:MAG: hypothetical protein BGO67_11775 [Alphaproteobacteria bacterium 41-28]|nr:MAG: hypothetical protein BGO67_11775 [Alphaproteobacteria bacterium 41-28]
MFLFFHGEIWPDRKIGLLSSSWLTSAKRALEFIYLGRPLMLDPMKEVKEAAYLCEKGKVVTNSPRLFPDLVDEPFGDEDPDADSWEGGSVFLSL